MVLKCHIYKMSHLIEDNLIDCMRESARGTILRASAIFTSMELAGSFLTGKTGQGTTKRNLETFCRSSYMPERYHALSPLISSIFRNGVSHSYITQGGALLGSDPSTSNHHLKFYRQGVFIYVPQFAEDVISAVRGLWKDINENGDLKANYTSVFKQLQESGIKKYNKFLKESNITPEEGTWSGDINIDLNQN